MVVFFISVKIPLPCRNNGFEFLLVDCIVTGGLQAAVERCLGRGAKLKPPKSLWELPGRWSKRGPVLFWDSVAESRSSLFGVRKFERT